jgi:hypothetical protein
MVADGLQLQPGARLLPTPRRPGDRGPGARPVHVVHTAPDQQDPAAAMAAVPPKRRPGARPGVAQEIFGGPPNAPGLDFWPRHRHGGRGRNVRFQSQDPGIQTWP